MAYDVAIVGAGAAGMYCACKILCKRDASVALIDSNTRPGRKLLMTGGGSMLFGLDKMIQGVTGIRTRVAQNPISCVVLGTGRALTMMKGLPEGIINLSQRTP